jgi:hypothetical protein
VPAVAQRVFESAVEEARQQGPTPEAVGEAINRAKGFLINQRFACHHHNQMFEHLPSWLRKHTAGLPESAVFCACESQEPFFRNLW